MIGLFVLFTTLDYEYVCKPQEYANYYNEYVGGISRKMTIRNRLGEALGPQYPSSINMSLVEIDGEMPSPSTLPQKRVPKRGPGRPAVIVCNHLGFIEIMAMICSPLSPGFTPKAELEALPFIGTLAVGL